MDVHDSEKARKDSAKPESLYKDVPLIAEERKIGKDESSDKSFDMDKLEEAVMNDDINKFKKLKMSTNQIIEYNYEVTG